MKKSELTQERLKEVLDYNPETGEFRWRVREKANRSPNDIAGCRLRSDYWVIHIDRRCYRAHQLAWLYMKGEWGRPLIDHRDGDPLNNRWRNLRLATSSSNSANRRRHRNNTSGFKGVWFHRPSGKWRARIRKDKRSYWLGHFDTPEQAHAACVAKARELFGEFARGE